MRLTFRQLPIIALFFILSTTIFAQTDAKTDKEIKSAAERSRKAANAFNDIMGKADKSIPRELLERAEAVAIFPGVLKAAFIVGGRGGEGLIVRRTPEGWSAPAFFKLGGGSIGFQIGADKTDYIMLFMNDGGLKGLLEDKFEFGGDVGIAAGPIGREASATTNATLDAGILSYSRSKGAFIGAALKGSRIAPDNDRNRALYGKTAKEILQSNTVTPLPDSVKDFPNTLAKYSNRRGKTVEGKTATQSTRQRTAVKVNTDNAIVVGSAAKPEQPEDTANENTSTTAINPAIEIYSIGRARPANRLAREIRAELLELPNFGVFDWIEFQILPDNKVVLFGQTKGATIRLKAEAVVKNIEGVAEVVNEIEDLPPSQSDDNLRAAIYKTVYSGTLLRYGTSANQSIHIIVRNGRVTLKGSVESEADKNAAAQQANVVTDAVEIKNELIVENGENP